jgi:hypothetical protein
MEKPFACPCGQFNASKVIVCVMTSLSIRIVEKPQRSREKSERIVKKSDRIAKVTPDLTKYQSNI